MFDQNQRVERNGQKSSWENVRAGVPQGSILETLFLIYRNDLSGNLSSNVKLFAVVKSLANVVQRTK